jgi:molecular chaperone GrpE
MTVQSDDLESNTTNTTTNTTPGGQHPAPTPAAGPADGAPAAESDDLETLRSELAEITQKADEYLRLAQRTQADFINYRRRMDDERQQQALNATIGFIQRLLPVLDDFERALTNATPEDLESSWGRGVLLVERNLRGILAAEDVQRISAEGAEFDPREHEALGQEPTAAVPPGHVVHVVRPGYRKGERIIRPAQVIVAAPPA